jgi:cell division protease FtsH
VDRSEAPSGVAAFGDATSVVSLAGSDVGAMRERLRRRRLWRLSVALGVPTAFLWYRFLVGRPFDVFRLPHVDWLVAAPLLFFVLLIGVLVLPYLFAGRSPHVLFRPEQIDVRLADIKGIDLIKEEVVRSLNLFLAHKTFASEMGGRPRRGLLFEGAPGTGKTFTAKAMAAEAGVPFLFVSATSFQSMFYGATARKIRSFFAELRKAARQEGGAIGFIEEIDAIGAARGGLSSATPTPIAGMLSGCQGGALIPAAFGAPAVAGGLAVAADRPITNQNGVMTEGVGGVVNELLVQMQSFDEPTGMQKLTNKMIDAVNLLLPIDRQLRKPPVTPTNVLLIAATNRADKLDPALLRPGRFDRKLSFELPDKRGRRELIEHFLGRKSHAPELEDGERIDALAAATNGYSPVMIEHIFDEALVNAVRRGETAMTWADVEQARLTEEVGLGQPVTYTGHEKRLIATHEAGHATVAHLIAPQRRLEILSIVKRRSALGLLAHGDREEVYTRSRSEMLALIQIAMGGQCAEEIFFGDVSTGPGGDLLSATNMAAQMVGAVGMTGTLISYAAVQNSAFHDTNIVGRVLADAEGRARVEELLQEQKQKARELLLDNRHLVEALRDALLERSELIGSEITDVLEAAGPVRGSAERIIDLREPAPVADA